MNFSSQKFGDIEDLQEEDSPLSVVVTFKSRSEAENVSRIMDVFFHVSKIRVFNYFCLPLYFNISEALLPQFELDSAWCCCR